MAGTWAGFGVAIYLTRHRPPDGRLRAPPRTVDVDVAYRNLGGTFYYLCSILDGASRSIVHWEVGGGRSGGIGNAGGGRGVVCSRPC